MMKRETLKVKSWNIDECENRAVYLLKTHVWRVKKALHSRFLGPFCVILERQTEDEKFVADTEKINLMSDLLGRAFRDDLGALEHLCRYYNLIEPNEMNVRQKKYFEEKLAKIKDKE